MRGKTTTREYRISGRSRRKIDRGGGGGSYCRAHKGKKVLKLGVLLKTFKKIEGAITGLIPSS